MRFWIPALITTFMLATLFGLLFDFHGILAGTLAGVIGGIVGMAFDTKGVLDDLH